MVNGMKCPILPREKNIKSHLELKEEDQSISKMKIIGIIATR